MSKGCKAYAVELSAYFDGELEGEALTRIETHLKDCGPCRATLDRLVQLRNALHQLSRPARPGRSILTDLKARMAEERKRSPHLDKTLMS